MSQRLQSLRVSAGFTLVETMAAITVFAIMTIGIVPLLATSMQGLSFSREQTIAKNVAQEAMERIRGLPYFDTQIKRDVLDLYFPNLGAGYNPTPNVYTFTTTCTATSSTPSASGALACPPKHSDGTSRIPSRFTVTFLAQFVTPAGGDPETFTPAQPPSTYDSATEATAIPPSSLLRMTITVQWSQGGTPRELHNSSLIGDRKLTEESIRASAAVDYVIETVTAYKDSQERVSGLNAVIGKSVSNSEFRSYSRATTDVAAGQMTLVRDEYTDSNGVLQPGVVRDSANGAEKALRSPPTVFPAPNVTASGDTITHPDLGGTTYGFMASTVVNEAVPAAGTQVVNGLPKAASNFSYTGEVGESFWVNNQVSPLAEQALKQLDSSKHVFSAHKLDSSIFPIDRIRGNTFTDVTPTLPLSGRKVEAKAYAEVGKLTLLPTLFASQGVVVIEEFKAETHCHTNGSTATPTGSWQAKLRYWRDANPTDGVALGAYTSQITISGSTTNTAADPLETLKQENPLVLDAPTSGARVFLFADAAAGKKGYLDTWDSTQTMASSATGGTADVSMPYAINIVTDRTRPDNAETKLTINIGKLSCQAVDKRV